MACAIGSRMDALALSLTVLLGYLLDQRRLWPRHPMQRARRGMWHVQRPGSSPTGFTGELRRSLAVACSEPGTAAETTLLAGDETTLSYLFEG
jgi:hypothetical protein